MLLAGLPDGRWERNEYAYVQADEAFRLAEGKETRAQGTYLMLNRAVPATYTRAAGEQWHRALRDQGTTESDISHRRALFIDVDAVRPSGTSACWPSFERLSGPLKIFANGLDNQLSHM
jgi:hypothetical protein